MKIEIKNANIPLKVDNRDSLIVSDITNSNKITKLDKELLKSVELSKSKRLVVRSHHEQTRTDIKEILESTRLDLEKKEIVFESSLDKCDMGFDKAWPLKCFHSHNGTSNNDLEFYRDDDGYFFKYNGISFQVVGYNERYIKKINTVPSNHIGGIEECVALIRKSLPSDIYKTLKVGRIDYQIIAHGMSYKELNRRLLVTRAKTIQLYRLSNRELTRYFGRHPLVVGTYDMRQKHKVEACKVEVRTNSKYIGVKHPSEVKEWVLSLKFNPFDQLLLLNFDYITSNRKRMIQFNVLSEVLGTQFAKTYLNAQSNATRDFKKVLFAKEPIKLSEVWEKGIREHFNVEGSHDLKTSTNEE